MPWLSEQRPSPCPAFPTHTRLPEDCVSFFPLLIVSKPVISSDRWTQPFCVAHFHLQRTIPDFMPRTSTCRRYCALIFDRQSSNACSIVLSSDPTGSDTFGRGAVRSPLFCPAVQDVDLRSRLVKPRLELLTVRAVSVRIIKLQYRILCLCISSNLT